MALVVTQVTHTLRVFIHHAYDDNGNPQVSL